MTEPRQPRRSWLAFAATTSALVLLASGGTAVLVQFGADEGQDPTRALHRTTLPSTAPSATPTVTVDRIVGTFHASTRSVSSVLAEHATLHSVLTPPSLSVPTAPEAPAAPPAAPLVPGAPPIPDVPTPQPTTPAVHPPVLPLPNPLPVTLPVPLPALLPLPLPTIPVPPLPGS